MLYIFRCLSNEKVMLCGINTRSGGVGDTV